MTYIIGEKRTYPTELANKDCKTSLYTITTKEHENGVNPHKETKKY
jgi:hypothetical protein